MSDSKAISAPVHSKENQRLRLYCLELAIRTDLSKTHHNDHVTLAQSFENYVNGTEKKEPA